MTKRIGERVDDEQIQVTGPFGFLLKARGREIYQTIVVLMCCGAVGYLIWEHKFESRDHDALLANNQIAIQEAVTELIYVTSLSPEQREKLRIEMPESLRKKVHEARSRGLDNTPQ